MKVLFKNAEFGVESMVESVLDFSLNPRISPCATFSNFVSESFCKMYSSENGSIVADTPRPMLSDSFGMLTGFSVSLI